MRYLPAFFLVLAASAQQPAQAPKPEGPQTTVQGPAQAATAKPDEQKPAEPAKPDTNPAPSAEQWLSGSIDFGYRWVPDVKGSFQEYRSVVNLGEGPKLFGLDFTIQDPKKRLFDRIDAQAFSWGDDPYTTAHIGARKLRAYEFNFDYRNIAYYNAVPSFANPNTPRGFDERSFDIRRRMTSFTLDLLPGGRIIPYLAYERNAGYGNSIQTWVQDANNEFAVPMTLHDRTSNFRGGLRFESNRFHVTLEQGGTTFRDDDQAFNSGLNPGDRNTPLLGGPIFLNGLSQAYGIRGHSIYERALFTAHAASWIDVYGQFLFSQPKTEANYQALTFGRFANVTALLIYNGLSELGTSAANQPHTTANGGFEMRPFRRLRIIESLMTDRFHDANSALLNSQFLGTATGTQTALDSLAYTQFVNFNQNQVDVLYDLTSKITLRGGYRRVWGDSTVLNGIVSPLGTTVSGELRRNIALASVNLRPIQKLNVNLEYEGASSDRIYFRTSLNDYHRARARARYQVTQSLMAQANLSILNNQNPATDIRYDFQSRNNSFSLFWTPASAKRFSVMAEYDRSTLRSDIQYLGLFFAPGISAYRDNAHTATASIDANLPHGAKITAGGSLFISSGSRPTHFYQPLGRLSVPLQKHVYWNTEWRWYGYSEMFYFYEPFRAHIVQTGLRLTR